MKKIIVFFSCIFILLTASLSVFASSVTHENFDLSVGYDTTEFNGAMRRTYSTGGLITNACGTTAISCANDMTGYASCTITALNGESETSNGSTKDSKGWVSSGTAKVSLDYAKKMNHYGRRYYLNSGNTEYFVCNIYNGKA